MYKLDPHIHSCYSPDSETKIEDIIKTAQEKNIEIIGISDHDTVDGSRIARKLDTDVLIIPSIEISSRDGHILGFGCSEKIEKNLPPAETIDRIHEHGGIAIIPHPFCFYRHGLLYNNDEHLKFDAVEVKNARFIIGYCNRQAKNLSKKNKIPGLGSSDAHYHKFVGDCYTEIDAEKDIDSVLKSIKKNRVTAKGKGTSNIQLTKYLIEKRVKQ